MEHTLDKDDVTHSRGGHLQVGGPIVELWSLLPVFIAWSMAISGKAIFGKAIYGEAISVKLYKVHSYI